MLSKNSWGLRWLVAIPLFFGCQSALCGGVSAYHHADYPLAARELRSAEQVGVGLSERPRYELYAGLTDLALGNSQGASEHLSRARVTFERNPGYYSREECARLNSAWRALGKMPGEPLLP